MPKLTITGTGDVTAILESVRANAHDVAEKALYKGAEIVADSVKATLSEIPESESNQWGTPYNPKPGPDPDEKRGLIDSFGISPMQSTGDKTDISIGFDGYNGKSTRQWPKGKPNAMIARSVERGTSFMYATPFMKPAVQQSRKAAKAAMAKSVHEEIEKLTK